MRLSILYVRSLYEIVAWWSFVTEVRKEAEFGNRATEECYLMRAVMKRGKVYFAI
jgi:hypothetical protein